MSGNNIKNLLIASALVALPFFALAEEGQMMKGEEKTMKQDLQQKRQVLEQEMRQKREALQAEMKQKREALMQEFKMKRETFEQEKQKRVDALKKKVGEERAKNIEKFFGNMVRKFEAAIDRLNKSADRIDSRLTKFADAGKDVTKFRDQLKAARDKITLAENALIDAKTQFVAMAKSDDPKVAFKKVKILVEGVTAKAKEAHRALVEVINSIKGASELKAATTPSTNQ